MTYAGMPSNILLNKAPSAEMVRDLPFYQPKAAHWKQGDGRKPPPLKLTSYNYFPPILHILKSTRHMVGIYLPNVPINYVRTQQQRDAKRSEMHL